MGFKKLWCLIVGHDIDVVTTHEFDPNTWIHTFTQYKKCLRCGKNVEKPVVTRLTD